MTLTPAEHYQRADELVAELERAEPVVAMQLPSVQFKLRLAEVHARLAQSPWWPGLVTDNDEDTSNHGGWDCSCESCARPAPSVETRSATGDRL